MKRGSTFGCRSSLANTTLLIHRSQFQKAARHRKEASIQTTLAFSTHMLEVNAGSQCDYYVEVPPTSIAVVWLYIRKETDNECFVLKPRTSSIELFLL